MTATPVQAFADQIETLLQRVATMAAEKVAARNTEREIERRVRERLAAEELSAAEVATLLGVHRSTLNQWRRDKAFPAPRKNPNGRIRWLRSEVEAFRAARPLSQLKVPS